MASNAIIGALRVVLGADTASLEKGLKSAQGSLSAFSRTFQKVVAGLSIGAAGTALAVSMKHAIDQADTLGKSAQKIGVPVEALSALKHAADLSGVSMETLEKSIGKLSKTMVEAASKPTSEAANAFRALGVSVTNADGSLKSSSQVLADVAGRFEGLKDGAGKTAVSMALFGRAGADLIPLLNSGKDGLQAMMDEARKLGIVIDKDTAKSAENFNDNLTRLGKVKDGIILRITAGMVPALENLSANMVRVAKDGDALKSVGESLGNALTGVFNVAERLSLMWQRLGVEWQAFKNAMSQVPFTDAWKKAWAEFNAAGAESIRMSENLRATQETAHLADAFGEIGKKTGEAAKPLREFNYAAMGGKSAIVQFMEAQQRSVAAMMADAQTTGMAAGAKERLRFVTEAYAAAAAKGIVPTEAMRIALFGLGSSAELAAMKMANMNLLGSNDPLAALRLQIDETNAKLAQGGLSAQDYATLSEQATALTAKYWQGMGTSVAGSLGQAAQAFGENSKTMAKVAKAAAIVQATIAMWQAGAEAIKLGFPQGLAAAAVMIAKGAAIVSSIRGINVGGFATGGSFTVPGGMGGGDRVRAMVDLEPGERVDVWRPDHGGADPRRGVDGAPSIVQVHVPDITRDYLGALIKGINGAIKDGYRLELAPV